MLRFGHFSTALIVTVVAALSGACSPAAVEDTLPAVESAASGGRTPAEETAREEGVGEQLARLLAGVEPPQSYELLSIPPGGGSPTTMIVKMRDGQPIKVKTMHTDGWMLVDLENGATFAYEPAENLVMKLPLGTEEDNSAPSPSSFVDSDARALRRDRINDADCWVVESRVGSLDSKVWIGTQDGLPRQFETPQGVTRFVYSRIDQVPASDFDLPPGAEIMDMARMMQRGFK